MPSQIVQIEGTAIPLRGDNIDTDRIIPARYLKSITFDGLGDHVFADDRKYLPAHPFSSSIFHGASILLVNENFGTGSSREHAPRALERWGIRACIGQSFSEIFSGNSLMIGLLCARVTRDEIEFLMRSAELEPKSRLVINVSDLTVQAPGRMVRIEMSEASRKSLLNGSWDATGLLLDHYDEVQTVARRLPYVRGF